MPYLCFEVLVAQLQFSNVLENIWSPLVIEEYVMMVVMKMVVRMVVIIGKCCDCFKTTLSASRVVQPA